MNVHDLGGGRQPLAASRFLGTGSQPSGVPDIKFEVHSDGYQPSCAFRYAASQKSPAYVPCICSCMFSEMHFAQRVPVVLDGVLETLGLTGAVTGVIARCAS